MLSRDVTCRHSCQRIAATNANKCTDDQICAFIIGRSHGPNALHQRASHGARCFQDVDHVWQQVARGRRGLDEDAVLRLARSKRRGKELARPPLDGDHFAVVGVVKEEGKIAESERSARCWLSPAAWGRGGWLQITRTRQRQQGRHAWPRSGDGGAAHRSRSACTSFPTGPSPSTSRFALCTSMRTSNSWSGGSNTAIISGPRSDP